MKSFLNNKWHLSIAVFLASSIAVSATYFDDLRSVSLGVGTNSIHSSNILEVVSTNKASKPCPQMTEAQRDAISSPQQGACIFNTDDDILNYYNGTIWGPISNPDSVLGPVSATDEAIARFDLTTGKLIQNSVVTITDAGIMAGATQFNVDNLRLDGNTLSSQDVNGNVVIAPNGTGKVITDRIQTSGSSGVGVYNSGGTLVADFGAANTTNSTIVGVTNIDDLQINGSTILTQGTNVSINLEPNGTGEVVSTKTIKGGLLQSTGELIVAESWQGAVQTNSSATGTDASLTNPVALAVNLTDGSLTSVGNIQTGVSTFAIVTNSTGGILTVKNDSTGTASHRILTGTGGDIELEDDASMLVYYEAGSVNRWRVIGGTGSGSGGPPPQQFTSKNTYNFESAVGNWVLYNDSSAAAVDCTGGTSSGDFLFSRETAAPLVGRGSGYINALNLANTQGEGVSALSDTIPSVYQGRPLELEFDYYGFASYASGDFAVYAYDVTNGALLNGGSSLGSLNSGYNRFHSLVYPSTNTASIRLCIHNTTTATTLKNLHFDEVRLKLAESVSVPLIGNWTTYAPTITTDSGSLPSRSSEVFRWRQDGPDILISTNITFSGTGSGSGFYIFTLPSGFTIKTSAVDNANNTSMGTFGAGGWYDQSSTPQGPILATGTGAANTIKFYGGGTSTNVPTNATIASGDRFNIIMRVPVNELSQNTIQGLASQANLVKVEVYKNGGSTTGSSKIASWTAEREDSHAAFNATSGVFTSPRKTNYIVILNAAITATTVNFDLFRNGTLYKRGILNDSAGSGAVWNIPAVDAEIGVTFEVRPNANVTFSSANYGAVLSFTEVPFSNTAINTGPIPLGTRTFTSSQANAPFTGKVYKDGQFAIIEFESILIGTLSGAINITLPSDLLADYDFTSNRNYLINDGNFNLREVGVNSWAGVANIASNNTVNIYTQVISSTYLSYTSISGTIPFTWGSGDVITGRIKYKVQGW